jgi:DNA (cytosine-5)-methyltransferase 1
MRLKAIDLYCKAGGATRGLQLAGFHVTGVDIEPQKNYCGDAFIQDDALSIDLSSFDFVWASPPCQRYSVSTGSQFKQNHPDLIEPTRERILQSGKPYVMENVEGARFKLIDPVKLCGTMFGLKVFRHRYFESNALPFLLLPPCKHDFYAVMPTGSPRRKVWTGTEYVIVRTEPTTAEIRTAMEIDWMIKTELDEAIPPAYSKFLAEIFLDSISTRRL